MGFRKRMIAAANARRLEMPVQLQIVAALNAASGVWAMVNARGSRGATAGLLWPGSADVVGVISRRYELASSPPLRDVRTVGVFFALEIKRPIERGKVAPSRSKTKPEQDEFLERVRSFGGIAGVARSVEDAFAILGLTPP